MSSKPASKSPVQFSLIPQRNICPHVCPYFSIISSDPYFAINIYQGSPQTFQYPVQFILTTNILFRIATPFIKEQTAASSWLLCRDITLPLFNKITKASNLLGEQLEGSASERIMAIIGHFTTLKGKLPQLPPLSYIKDQPHKHLPRTETYVPLPTFYVK